MPHYVPAQIKTDRRRGLLVNQRVRGIQRNEKLPFTPPEDWHEPKLTGATYKVITQAPGQGYRHVLTPDDIRARLAQVPQQFLRTLEVVQLSRMTRKKQSFPCYGIQWGAAIYLYPIETELVERYPCPPTPNQVNESRMYGGLWQHESAGVWSLTWTEEALRDFYLNNILIHELGHLVDGRNNRHIDRERYAEWFALEYGYKRSRRPDGTRRTNSTRSGRRHDSNRTGRLLRA